MRVHLARHADGRDSGGKTGRLDFGEGGVEAGYPVGGVLFHETAVPGGRVAPRVAVPFRAADIVDHDLHGGRPDIDPHQERCVGHPRSSPFPGHSLARRASSRQWPARRSGWSLRCSRRLQRPTFVRRIEAFRKSVVLQGVARNLADASQAVDKPIDQFGECRCQLTSRSEDNPLETRQESPLSTCGEPHETLGRSLEPTGFEHHVPAAGQPRDAFDLVAQPPAAARSHANTRLRPERTDASDRSVRSCAAMSMRSDKPRALQHREHVIAVAPPGLGHEDLDPVVKPEEPLRALAIPQGRIERAEDPEPRTGARTATAASSIACRARPPTAAGCRPRRPR
jgi:hypothetical protein